MEKSSTVEEVVWPSRLSLVKKFDLNWSPDVGEMRPGCHLAPGLHLCFGTEVFDQHLPDEISGTVIIHSQFRIGEPISATLHNQDGDRQRLVHGGLRGPRTEVIFDRSLQVEGKPPYAPHQTTTIDLSRCNIPMLNSLFGSFEPKYFSDNDAGRSRISEYWIISTICRAIGVADGGGFSFQIRQPFTQANNSLICRQDEEGIISGDADGMMFVRHL